MHIHIPPTNTPAEVSPTTDFSKDTELLDADWLKKLCIEIGADDVGFVSLDRPEIADQKEDILSIYPKTQTLISFVVRMNHDSVRSPMRSVANHEFHDSGDDVNHITRKLVKKLREKGISAVNPAMAFPMEMKGFPDKKSWLISHKPVAVAAGLGQMGIHRNVIHPKFGNFILLGTILVDAFVKESKPIDFNPCFECKLCVAACPVGAISPDGHFNFSACLTHNYREFLGGFNDWTENVVNSKSSKEYYQKVTPGEGASMWQSLSYGANYNAAYCMAVCPAGDDIIDQYTTDKKEFLSEVVKPLQQKEETLYVTENSDALAYAQKRFPHKEIKVVGNGAMRLSTVKAYIENSHHFFQRNQAKDLDASFYFKFSGKEERDATFVIKNKELTVHEGKYGEPTVTVTADSQTWLDFLAKDAGIVPAILRGKIRIKGPIRLMNAFGKCFG